MRKCRECGGVIEERIGNRHYDESGVKGILLVGITLRRCGSCNAEEFGVPRMSDLHRLIALTIARKSSPLTGSELRLLRKHLGYSGEDLARRLDVSREHLSRWENGAHPLSAMAERLVRLMVVHNDRAPDYSLDELAAVPKGKPTQLRLEVRLEGGAWKAAAA